jgi:hypothetical protein
MAPKTVSKGKKVIGGQHYVATGACGAGLHPGSGQSRSGEGRGERPRDKSVSHRFP